MAMFKGHIPKNQYSRPSLNLDHEHEREWRTAPAGEIELGDLVPDFGIVVSLRHVDNPALHTTIVHVENPDGRTQAVPAEMISYFFGRKQ